MKKRNLIQPMENHIWDEPPVFIPDKDRHAIERTLFNMERLQKEFCEIRNSMKSSDSEKSI
ncbi:MAG TPA: hypothetical protein DEQ30_13080 [Porphyromonadaceae bacterium]|nr:hypothetical protein [Porphyromonadaceae bacterium]